MMKEIIKGKYLLVLMFLAFCAALVCVEGDKDVYANSQQTTIVNYGLESARGETVAMRVDYDRTDNSILNVGFHLKANKANGMSQYEFVTAGNEKIYIRFYFQNNNVVNVGVDTDFQAKENNTEGPRVFSLLSQEGDEIIFTFTWDKDGNIRNVNIKPRINPFEKD